MKTQAPTLEQFTAYQLAWNWFNERLFSGSLSPCLLNFSRHSKAYGFFVANKWANHGTKQKAHEISLNPDVLLRPLKETMGTLVHEMVHQWQQDHGKAPRRCYHDRQWAEKMESIGLMPSHTGQPDGKRTGVKVTHYIISEGAFEQAFAAMPEGYLIPWLSAGILDAKKTPKSQNKIKYTCPSCEAAVWGKPGLNVTCGDCEEAFEEQIS